MNFDFIRFVAMTAVACLVPLLLAATAAAQQTTAIRVACLGDSITVGARVDVRGETPNRPNIVLFLVDDMGWQDTSVPFHTSVTELNRRYRTPNMERLSKSGMTFTQAYACSPSSPVVE